MAKVASIHLNRRTMKWELWFQSRPIVISGISWQVCKQWGEDHGYAIVGPRAEDVDLTDDVELPQDPTGYDCPERYEGIGE